MNLSKFSDVQVRAFVIDGVTWYVASDIGLVLGYKNPKDAITRHCKDARFVTSLTHSDVWSQWNIGNRTKLIQRSDILRLVTNSQLPQAKEIEKWIFEDVVPTVIDTGIYLREDTFTSIDQIELLQRSLEAQKALILEKQALEAKILEDAPKVSMWDKFMDAEGLIDIGDAAKALSSQGFKIGRNRFFALLRGAEYLFKNDLGFNTPYQPKVEAGYFKIKYEAKRIRGKVVQYPHCYLTSKGLEHIYRKFFQE